MTRAVRERVWQVLTEWWATLPGGSILLVWKDDAAPGRLGVRSLGIPSRTLADLDGVLVTRKG